MANLRVLTPNQHVCQSLDHCVSPRYRNALEHQVARANHDSDGTHTPQTLTESLARRQRWLDPGDMLG
ncbi:MULTISPECIES: hypothetical protein [Xanthomonas]|uniref:Uncharacterized protein n=1 Tax=Xanthomonas dyei TaxID=743699 RepID=A0ABZ0DA82_9XANT|nr:hypothetical protein [Xanthomonas dyei]WOB27011.1 hypothetical protein NYR99_03235 [Xanthomonas dyei]WOB54633.1 hypothetical protein NYR95_03240 [Xanthomonas dyei]